MPMGIVSDEEFQKEIKDSLVPSSPTPIPISEIIPSIPSSIPPEIAEIMEVKRGRKVGDVNVPSGLRTIIADTDLMEGRSAAVALAKDFGISPSSVSAYSNASTSTSTYHKEDRKLADHIKERKLKATNTALSKLTRAMRQLSEDKIGMSSAKEISSIAKDMASVVKLMDTSSSDFANSNQVMQPQFLVYAPQVHDERHFGDVIQAKE